MGLGGAEVVTLADARERARLARRSWTVSTRWRPASQRVEQRRAQAATITFREAAKAVIETRNSDWSAGRARRMAASIAESIRPRRLLPAAAIDTALVLKAVEPIWRRAQNNGKIPDPPAVEGA